MNKLFTHYLKQPAVWLVVFCLFAGQSVLAQSTVSGKVTDSETGESLPGVNVQIDGTSSGSVTDMDGNYTLSADADGKLNFSFVGYVTQTIEIGGRSTINVSLSADIKQLSEVVVTAFGVEKSKKSIGYAVSEVGSEDIATVKGQNFINNLSGRVPGLVITQSTGGPGSGTRVVIRGNNSLTGNNQPLYVVDGVPVDNSGFGSSNDGGTGEYAKADYGTGISDINPDDIESVTVLKGPNAAALYGSRASNGVVMITTKQGKSGSGLGISYSSSMQFENPLLLPDYQNQYGQGAQGNVDADLENLKTKGGSWGAKMDGANNLYWTGENRSYSAQPDNVKNFFRTGSSFVNSIALDGGNDKISARFSYTNNRSNSILPNSYLNKHNFNLRTVANLTDKLTIDSKATYFYQFAKNRAVQGTEGIMAYLYGMPRNSNISDYENFQNPADYSARAHTSQTGNPYWILNNDLNEDSRKRFQGFLKATYDFNEYFTAFARIGTDAATQKIETVNSYGHWFYGNGRFNYSQNSVAETNADFLLMFSKQMSTDFHLDVNVGGNHRYQSFERTGIAGNDFKIPTKATVASARTLVPSYTPLREKKVNSLYASASMSFKDFVFLDLSARNDWSSTLPKDNRSFFYPSASLSFMLSELIDMDQIDFLKIRTGWAQVGKDTDAYQLQNAFNLNTNGYLGLTTLSRPDVFNDVNLKPEQATSIEVGAELKMFQNRLFADVSYYDITSENLIMNVPVTGLTGYSQFHTNVGKMTNKGIEILIGGVPVQTADFTWETSINFAKNTNELVELISGLDNFVFTANNSGSIAVQATVGGGFGDIYGTTYQKTADGRTIVDASGRPLATADKTLLGNYQPDWTSGFSNTVTYKNFILRALVDARIGGELYSGTDASLVAGGVAKETLQYRETGVVVDGVVNTGTADEPVYTANTVSLSAQDYWGAWSGIASNNIIKQTNVRLRELSLGYRVPSSVLGDGIIKGASFDLIARNLFFLYKSSGNFDPESSYSTSNFSQGVLYYNLPSTRMIGFNINLKF